jgi:hypothetical protein
MGLDEPVASICLKLLRLGSQVYDYSWLLSQKESRPGHGGPDIQLRYSRATRLQWRWGHPGMWGHNAEEWESNR